MKTKSVEPIAKHTPGPWVINVDPEDTNEVWGITGADGTGVVETDMGYYNPKMPDALLIAAAPELLEACEWLLMYMEDEMDKDVTRKGVAFAQEAIAKAKGGK